MKLIDKLKAIKSTEFQWVAFSVKTTIDETNEQKQYVVFELADPIANVTGTNRIYDPLNRGNSVLVSATDVTEVECFFDIIEEFESEFKFDEDKDGKLIGTGSYAGNLRLDVSRKDRVWLVKESFAKSSFNWKAKASSKQFQDYIAAQKKS